MLPLNAGAFIIITGVKSLCEENAMSSKIPRGTHLPTEARTVQKTDTNLKNSRENVPRKNVAPKVHKGVSTRYGQQVELKEQNQNLVAAKEELQKNLSEKQQRVEELELQLDELQKENVEFQKNLQDCHRLLVSAKIDPVLGERVGDAARQKEDERKEVMSVSTDLLRELKAFGDIASQQRTQLQEIQATMEDVTKARELMKQERENFSQEAAEMERALKEAEELLA
uniref:Kinetochore localized astrin (SPAG5) binding protein n=1 Tax=Poecilia latipinna TaxID=48699 RepID=A0A3B3UDF9_9TELE